MLQIPNTIFDFMVNRVKINVTNDMIDYDQHLFILRNCMESGETVSFLCKAKVHSTLWAKPIRLLSTISSFASRSVSCRIAFGKMVHLIQTKLLWWTLFFFFLAREWWWLLWIFNNQFRFFSCFGNQFHFFSRFGRCFFTNNRWGIQ